VALDLVITDAGLRPSTKFQATDRADRSEWKAGELSRPHGRPRLRMRGARSPINGWETRTAC